MDKPEALAGRYERIHAQLQGLLQATDDPTARLATVAALLHHKMPHFFWTGFYRLVDGELTVGPYQGPLACQVLEKNRGVCWAGINQKQSLVVPDIHAFPGHVACDSRSRSEIVVPLFDDSGQVWGILDVDSSQIDAFSDVDRSWLEKIVSLI